MTSQWIQQSHTKSNDNKICTNITVTIAPPKEERIFLPVPPLHNGDLMTMEIYTRFMRHLRLLPAARGVVRILSAIEFSSDILDLNDAVVTKVLADMGLRAPRCALPQSYLDYVDRSLERTHWDVGGPSPSSLAMWDYWELG